MKPILSVTGALAAAMLVVQPCLAAEDIRDRTDSRYRPSAYAGASYRMSLGGAGKAQAGLRLQAGVARSRDGNGSIGSAQALQVSALEVGASADGRPLFSLAGQDVRDVERRLGVRGSTGTTLLIVGGVLVLVAVVGLMSSGGQLGPCTSPGC